MNKIFITKIRQQLKTLQKAQKKKMSNNNNYNQSKERLENNMLIQSILAHIQLFERATRVTNKKTNKPPNTKKSPKIGNRVHGGITALRALGNSHKK